MTASVIWFGSETNDTQLNALSMVSGCRLIILTSDIFQYVIYENVHCSLRMSCQLFRGVYHQLLYTPKRKKIKPRVMCVRQYFINSTTAIYRIIQVSCMIRYTLIFDNRKLTFIFSRTILNVKKCMMVLLVNCAFNF